MDITKVQLNKWLVYYKQYKNAWHMSDSDIRELLQLNHRIMEAVHDVHNTNMMHSLKDYR